MIYIYVWLIERNMCALIGLYFYFYLKLIHIFLRAIEAQIFLSCCEIYTCMCVVRASYVFSSFVPFLVVHYAHDFSVSLGHSKFYLGFLSRDSPTSTLAGTTSAIKPQLTTLPLNGTFSNSAWYIFNFTENDNKRSLCKSSFNRKTHANIEVLLHIWARATSTVAFTVGGGENGLHEATHVHCACTVTCV